MPGLSPEQLIALTERTAKLPIVAGLSKETVRLCVNSFASPSGKIKALLEVGTGKEHITAAVLTAAVSYCGANPNRTSDLVWTECVNQLARFFGDLCVNEILEAFRLAADQRWDSVNLTAYNGQFSVKVLSDVLKAYVQDRNRVKVGVDKALAQWTEEHLQQVHLQKEAAAREQFFQDFQALKARWKEPFTGVESTKSEIHGYWFNALKERGVFDFIPKARREALWTESWDLLRDQTAVEAAQEKTLKVVTLNRVLQSLEGGARPEDQKGRATAIYQRLLILEALDNE